MRKVLSRIRREEAGQDLIEYGLLIGIITLAAMTAILSIGGKVSAYFAALDGLLP